MTDSTRSNPHGRTEAKRRNAIDFYRLACFGGPACAANRFVGAEYIQHNPLVGNGRQPFIEYFEQKARDYPDKRFDFVRTAAEGDLVRCAPTGHGPNATSTSRWISFASTRMEKSSSTGTQFRR